jgi:hypothetical protein
VRQPIAFIAEWQDCMAVSLRDSVSVTALPLGALFIGY